MIVRLEKSSGVPITRQILDQIRTQCATGALRPGDRLPSVRRLARDLTVNQNTILRVYERLEAEGLIERRHGAGTFVADCGGKDPMAAEREQLDREIDALVHHAVALGLTSRDLKSAVARAYDARATDPNETEGKPKP